MSYRLGKGSKSNLVGVSPEMVKLVTECIKITPVDFIILNNGGLRTASMQNALYKRGASKLNGRSRKSKHQKQPSGFGEAVDLVPYVNGPRWEWPLIYPIAGIMAALSKKHNIDIRWGGVWDRELDDFIGGERDPKKLADIMRKEVRDYTIRHPGPDFIDGPHYELH
jgi:peptidoglycan L-alanyl-D-glutamate endopeptidase CwlK